MEEEKYKKKSFLYRSGCIGKTIYNNINFIKNISPLIFKNDDNIIDVLKNNNYNFKNNHNKGLYVIIHELLSYTFMLGQVISEAIKEKNLKYDVIIPKVPFKGNCSLSDASMPIYRLIVNYISNNPNKPIHIIASSNGCRIASFIETKLRNINVNIRITSIVGAYGGSRIVEKNSQILSLILHQNIIEDMKLNSKINNELKKNMMNPITKGTRYYEFYGTANDWIIPNIDDCFPQVNATKVIYHKLAEGIGHVSLGFYRHEEILNNSIEWMKTIYDIK